MYILRLLLAVLLLPVPLVEHILELLFEWLFFCKKQYPLLFKIISPFLYFLFYLFCCGRHCRRIQFCSSGRHRPPAFLHFPVVLIQDPDRDFDVPSAAMAGRALAAGQRP